MIVFFFIDLPFFFQLTFTVLTLLIIVTFISVSFWTLFDKLTVLNMQSCTSLNYKSMILYTHNMTQYYSPTNI